MRRIIAALSPSPPSIHSMQPRNKSPSLLKKGGNSSRQLPYTDKSSRETAAPPPARITMPRESNKTEGGSPVAPGPSSRREKRGRGTKSQPGEMEKWSQARSHPRTSLGATARLDLLAARVRAFTGHRAVTPETECLENARTNCWG